MFDWLFMHVQGGYFIIICILFSGLQGRVMVYWYADNSYPQLTQNSSIVRWIKEMCVSQGVFKNLQNLFSMQQAEPMSITKGSQVN